MQITMELLSESNSKKRTMEFVIRLKFAEDGKKGRKKMVIYLQNYDRTNIKRLKK